MLTWLGNDTSKSDKQIFFRLLIQNVWKKNLLSSLISVVTRSNQHITAPVGKHYYRNVVEAHCYVVKYSRIDREQWRSRINQSTDCRTFRPHRPLSAACKTVLYAADKGLCGWNALQSIDWLILLRYCSQSIRLHYYRSLQSCPSHHKVQSTSLAITINITLTVLLLSMKATTTSDPETWPDLGDSRNTIHYCRAHYSDTIAITSLLQK